MKIIVIISANAEWKVVKPMFEGVKIEHFPFGEYFLSPVNPEITYLHGGWGKISAAATAQYALDHFKPELLVNLGTCGGFAGHIERGEIILVDKTIVYDIIEQMGSSEAAIQAYSTPIDLFWLGAVPQSLNIRRGLLVSADRDIVVEDIPLLVEKYGAVAADWESGAIAWVARRNGVRCLILRGVSDLVGGEGGEAYGNLKLFQERTRAVMEDLIKVLPVLLKDRL